jgi:hypothetical protein
MTGRVPSKASLAALFEARRAKLARCFAPPMTCVQPAIRAHSIQNAGVLDLLSENGHVVAPVLRLDPKTGPSVQLKRVGRNQATTFAGLCSEHDASIFEPIEKSPLDLSNPEHRFLLAYRTTHYELHATGSVASQVQTFHAQRVELGLEPQNEATPSSIFAVERLYVSWLTFRYKAELDMAYLERRFDILEHELLILDVDAPTLAASSFFSLGTREEDHRDLIGVCATIAPVSAERTAVLISYLPRDAAYVRATYARVLSATGEQQKYEVSRMILNHAENFVLAPSFVDSWTTTKTSAVLDLFLRTLIEPDFGIEDRDFMLFR